MRKHGLNNNFKSGKKRIFAFTLILCISGYFFDFLLYNLSEQTVLITIDFLVIISLSTILILFFLKKRANFKTLNIVASWIMIGSIIIANLFFMNDLFSNSVAELYLIRGYIFAIIIASVTTGMLGSYKQLYLQLLAIMGTVVYLSFTHDYEFLKNNLILFLLVSFGFGSVISFFGFYTQSFSKKVQKQNRVLEVKNSEVTDSIVYAKRIQNAILPNKTKIKTVLPNLSFLYIEKDIVAGDFYFVEEFEKRKYFGVADATGHGVPGALVSIVCLNALGRVLRENEGLVAPNEILNHTRKIIIEELNKNVVNVNDGMDIGLCSIYENKLEFSGANISLFMVRNGELIIHKGDRQPIGNYHTNNEYSLYSIELEKGDTVYVTTDGYYDQFGEATGKKYKVKRYKEFLPTINHLSITEQKQALRNEFYDWKGSYDQIDDVCLLIFKY